MKILRIPDEAPDDLELAVFSQERGGPYVRRYESLDVVVRHLLCFGRLAPLVVHGQAAIGEVPDIGAAFVGEDDRIVAEELGEEDSDERERGDGRIGG